jgi:hypothetical protein
MRLEALPMSLSTRSAATLRVLVRLVVVIAVFGVGVLLGSIASAQMDDDGGCVFDRRVYPEGEQMCQGSDLMRCSDGAWEDVGDCDEEEPGPPPIAEGGDVEMD